MANVVTPNSTVHFCDVPLDNTYENEIYFASRETQLAYFSDRIKHTYQHLKYIRKVGVEAYLEVPNHVDELRDSNYVIYQNLEHGTKWFFAFITRMEYISEGNTRVYLETDVYQTWLTEMSLKQSFVEREHVMDDTVGKNIYPEGLETGEYINNYSKDLSEFTETYIVIATTQIYEGEGDSRESMQVAGDNYNGVYSALKYVAFPNTEIGIFNTNGFIEYMEKNHAGAIQSVFLVPKFIVENKLDGFIIEGSSSAFTTEGTIYKRTVLDTYEPRNKKLLCYPYNYLLVTNNAGASTIYHYELFKTTRSGYTNDCIFKIAGALCPSGSMKLIPEYYKGQSENFLESITGAKYPICNWTSDVYTNWLTQNAVNFAIQDVSNVSSGIGTATKATGQALSDDIVGGLGTSVSGGINVGLQVTKQISEKYQHSLIPPQAKGNINSGDVVYALKKSTFTLCQMSIQRSFAERIDKYFDMFGYLVNTVKVPNISGRKSWNYVKTIGCNITGAIPDDDMQRLKKVFDDGCTFWKSNKTVGDYSQDNTL